MIKIVRQSFISLLLLIGFLSVTGLPLTQLNAYAAQSDQRTQHSTQHRNNTQGRQDTSGHATVIALDMSGSMVTSDPHGYRCSAADSYIALSGTNDYIGLVGLDNNNGATTGSHNFQSAQIWTSPLPTETIQDQNTLRTLLTQHDTNQHGLCGYDSNTPTYDSLSKAYDMLAQVTSQHHVTGSVILLTDGIPCPDVDAQINAIRSDLLPKFSAHNWPIDTIGLGEDSPIAGTTGCSVPGTLPGTFQSFLKGISSATGGNFYSDAQGSVVSALNIAPFFAQIFAKYAGKTLHEDIPATSINGETQQRNFTVVDGTTELDTLAVRDNSGVQITLLNPQGQPVSSNDAGVSVTNNAYNVIYSVKNPLPGPWILNVTGTGQYLMDDLQQSNIDVAIDSIQLGSTGLKAPQALPLGQTLTVSAHMTANGQALNDSTYTVNGYATYNSGNSNCTQALTQATTAFTMRNNGGTYTGSFSIPANGAAGTYNVLLCASNGSAQNVIANKTTTVRLAVFPTPYFISPTTSQPTDTTVTSTAIRWPWLLQKLYGVPFLRWLGGWPLQGTSAQLQTSNLNGELQWNGQPYTNAVIQSPAKVSYGQKSSLDATIVSDGPGKFSVLFPLPDDAPANSRYTITFETSGSYQDGNGPFGPTQRTFNVVIQDAPFAWVAWAWIKTFSYVLLLFVLGILIIFAFTPRPYGEWSSMAGDTITGRRFAKAPRDIFWIFHRNILRSRAAGMPSGLLLRFRRSGVIEARLESAARAKEWKLSNGGSLSQNFQRVQKLIFAPTSSTGQNTGYSDDDATRTYTIHSYTKQDKTPGLSPRSKSSRSRIASSPSTSQFGYKSSNARPTSSRSRSSRSSRRH